MDIDIDDPSFGLEVPDFSKEDGSNITFKSLDSLDGEEVIDIMEWKQDGSLLWKGREITIDDELRSMIRDIHGWFVSMGEDVNVQ